MHDRPKWKKKPAMLLLLLIIGLIAVSTPALADQNYSQQVFFENSASPGYYFYSTGKASAPSSLKLINGRLPVETSTFISGPNAIELQWQSTAPGGWAELSGDSCTRRAETESYRSAPSRSYSRAQCAQGIDHRMRRPQTAALVSDHRDSVRMRRVYAARSVRGFTPPRNECS